MGCLLSAAVAMANFKDGVSVETKRAEHNLDDAFEISTKERAKASHRLIGGTEEGESTCRRRIEIPESGFTSSVLSIYHYGMCELLGITGPF